MPTSVWEEGLVENTTTECLVWIWLAFLLIHEEENKKKNYELN